MKYIEKKSTANIPGINGAVVDTLNVENKITNAPSIRIVQEMIKDVLGGTILYESTEHETSEVLADDISNYKRIKVFAKSEDGQNVIQELLTSQIGESSGNLITSFWAGSSASNSAGTGYVFYGKTARLILNGNTFTLDRERAMTIEGTKTTYTTGDSFTILKIVGYDY